MEEPSQRTNTRAPRFVLISGASRRGDTAGLPTLVVQGANDHMMRTDYVHDATRGRDGVTYVEVAGGHFILVEEAALVRRTIADWLRVTPGSRSPG